jgi:hypothetical protein
LTSTINTQRIGQLSEFYVAYKLSDMGFSVAIPTGSPRYDLIVEKENRRYFIQVKSVVRNDEFMRVQLGDGYTREEVDAIAVHERRDNKVYYIPIEEIDGRVEFVLRVSDTPTERGRKRHFARDYEDFPY